MKPTILILFSFLFVTGCNPFQQKQPARRIEIPQVITGSWDLIFLKGIDSSGRIHYPYGRTIKGFAVFDKQNNFTIQYYDATRSRMSNSDPFYSSDAEIRIAFLSGASFFGNYHLAGDSLILNIKAASNPNLNLYNEIRFYQLHGDTLLMIAPTKKLNGILFQEHSVWKRTGK